MKTRSQKNIPEVHQSDNSDSEPEEIGFSLGRHAANQAEKDIAAGIKSQQELLKHKRKKIHERNFAQKYAKIARQKELEKRKLPVEFLEEMSKGPRSKGPMPVITYHSEEENSPPKKDRLLRDSNDDDQDTTESSSDNFISIHGTTQFQVSVLPKILKKATPVSTSAADFRQNMLNRKGIMRQPVKDLLSKKEKQAVNRDLSFRKW